MIDAAELVIAQMLVNIAIIECHFECRPFCIFNHPEFPGEQFEIGGVEPFNPRSGHTLH